MINSEPVADKVAEIFSEMKHNGLLKGQDFHQWLQTVYLPDCKAKAAGEKDLIVPHAVRILGDDVNKGKLLQLLIELDALI